MSVSEPPSGATCELRSVSKSFGAVPAVDDVSLHIDAGSLACLIGPNGAGKSTLLACVSGFLVPEAGSVLIDGRNVTRWSAHRRAEHGVATVFQTTRALPGLSVLDNAMVGAHAWTHTGFVEAVLRPPWQWREERLIRAAAIEALAAVGLEQRAHAPAASLPLGQLRLLAVARALVQRPRLLLLDEPAAGLRTGEKELLAETFIKLKRERLTQMLVEHDMQFVGSVAERIVVLDRGRIIADGAPEDVRQHEAVVEAYLGSATL